MIKTRIAANRLVIAGVRLKASLQKKIASLVNAGEGERFMERITDR